MILYGSSLSPFVRKVLAFANEKGIELELQPTGFPSHSAEFLEASPFRKMPALRDGDYTLPDSSAIVHYLEAVKPEPALIPSDPKLRGKAIWFDEFSDTIMRGATRAMVSWSECRTAANIRGCGLKISGSYRLPSRPGTASCS